MTIRQRLRAAKTRAFDRYVERYGELHHADPRVNEVVIMGDDDRVAELLRAANAGEPYPEHLL